MSHKQQLELSDSLSKKTAQLESLLIMANGKLGDCSDDVRENYLWACQELSTQIRAEFDRYWELTKDLAKPEGREPLGFEQHWEVANGVATPKGGEL